MHTPTLGFLVKPEIRSSVPTSDGHCAFADDPSSTRLGSYKLAYGDERKNYMAPSLAFRRNHFSPPPICPRTSSATNPIAA